MSELYFAGLQAKFSSVTAELTLTARVYDPAEQAAGGYYDLRAEVACRGYGGQTQFWISGRDLGRFVDDLESLSVGRADVAQLVGGWDDREERLRLRVSPPGGSGRSAAAIKIATNGPRSDQWQRIETDFVCPPDAVQQFLNSLRQLADRRATGEARLVGDGDAIA